MAKFYSPSTKGFYASEIHGDNKPVDCVEITDEEHQELINGQASGLSIVFDADLQKPVLKAPPAPTLEELKAAKNKYINDERAKANLGTFPYKGKQFACDALSRSDIDGVNGYVTLTGELPPTFPNGWKAVDNTYVLITSVADWTSFYAAMVAQGAANFAKAQQLKADLAAANTPEEVAAIVW